MPGAYTSRHTRDRLRRVVNLSPVAASILLDEVIDGFCLVAVDPACEGGKEELQSEEIWRVVTPLIDAFGVVSTVQHSTHR